jgi:DNA-binding LytR/AlgR family response regulator
LEKVNCIIIDDEPLAVEVLEDYVRQIPFLKLVGSFGDAVSASAVIQSQNIDALFLDIHLPVIKGLDFIKTLRNPPQIIITTAYHEYALKGFDLNVVDYLLKPIELSRFLTAVNKLKRTPSLNNSEIPEIFFFNVNKKKVKVVCDEILYVESLKEYVRIVTANKSLITKYQLGQIEDLLPQKHFMRIHRSFIVAKNKIDAYTATDVEIMGKVLPIGKGYKELVGGILQTMLK